MDGRSMQGELETLRIGNAVPLETHASKTTWIVELLTSPLAST